MSADVRIRVASSADLEALVPLVVAYHAFYGVDRDRADVTEFLRERLDAADAIVLLAEPSDGGAAGFALAYPTWDTLELASRWILHDLYVAPSHRRAGIARALLRAVVAAASSAGAAAVTLETAHDNVEAQPLYESEGFTHDRVYRTYHRGLTDG